MSPVDIFTASIVLLIVCLAVSIWIRATKRNRWFWTFITLSVLGSTATALGFDPGVFYTLSLGAALIWMMGALTEGWGKLMEQLRRITEALERRGENR